MTRNEENGLGHTLTKLRLLFHSDPTSPENEFSLRIFDPRKNVVFNQLLRKLSKSNRTVKKGLNLSIL